LGQLLESYRQDWLVEDLLMKADRMTMANSIELRVPFLDYRLVEWAARAPDEVKVRRAPDGRWDTKWVLRELCRGILPPEIVRRPKEGFALPAYERLSTTMAPWAEETLGSDPVLSKWLRPDGIRELLAAGTRPQATELQRQQLWAVLMLEMWARAWLAN
jgi:asparagine synthase (glutamine-hydrolysing)